MTKGTHFNLEGLSYETRYVLGLSLGDDLMVGVVLLESTTNEI